MYFGVTIRSREYSAQRSQKHVMSYALFLVPQAFEFAFLWMLWIF